MPSANDKRCGFEIKLGANQVDSAADGLLKVQKEILKERRETGQNTVCTLRLVQCRIPKTGWCICRSNRLSERLAICGIISGVNWDKNAVSARNVYTVYAEESGKFHNLDNSFEAIVTCQLFP